MRKIARPSLIFFAITVLGGCSSDNLGPSFFEVDESIYKVAMSAPIYNLNDAGVGDLNADGTHELWTTNHSSYQWIRQFSTNRELSAREIQLPQDARYPGIEYGGEYKPLSSAMQIHTLRSSLVLRNTLDTQSKLFQGTIEIPWESEITNKRQALVEQRACQPEPCFLGDFQVQPGGELQVTPIPAPSDGFPINVSLAESIDLSLVAVGRDGIQPDTHNVRFALRDRHAIAQADVLGDSKPEFFVSRGGARGRLDDVDPGASDELFVIGQDGFIDRLHNSGIMKEGCPGRAARWIDVDLDGDLDLYQVCGRADQANGNAANRLYVQIERGMFTEQAADYGLALAGSGQFGWLPTTSGTAIFLWVTAQSIELYTQAAPGERFERYWSTSATLTPSVSLSFLDIDFDAEQEVLIASEKKNLLLDGLPLEPNVVSLAELGGPQASVEGEMGDFNADGQPDVFLVPQGLYTFTSDGQLEAQPGLTISSPKPIRSARSNWLDIDGDGDLDLWLAVKDPYLAPGRLRSLRNASPSWLQSVLVATTEGLLGPLDWHDRQWHSVLLLQENSESDLLQIDVVGTKFNSHAIGTTVSVSTSASRTQSQVVGVADGSRFSQTHYRRYFGIDATDPIIKVTAVFSDGAIAEVMNPPTQRVLRIEHPDIVPARRK